MQMNSEYMRGMPMKEIELNLVVVLIRNRSLAATSIEAD